MVAEVTTASTEYLTCAETARLIRAALKQAHPGVKFSVRSKTYAGGASIDVEWVDGPTRDQVRLTTQLYTGADFDGMIDLKSYHDSVLVDERGEPRVVSFGADFVFEHRKLSPEFTAAATGWLEERLAGFAPYDPNRWLGGCWASDELYRLCERTVEGDTFSF